MTQVPGDVERGVPPVRRSRRALLAPEPVIDPFTTSDGVQLRLTRYEGGRKGPVVLSHAYGTSSLVFSIDTIEVNLVEYLVAEGYDVWLLDYRCSPQLPSAGTQFSLDEIAAWDYPAAIEKVRGESGADSVQVVAHCVGSMTFLMAMMAGLRGVRSAVCSQLTAHAAAPTLNHIKAGTHLASILPLIGIDTISTSFEECMDWRGPVLGPILDKMLTLYPVSERCDSPVCRRIAFLYGESYSHGNLNDATHAAIPEMFGVANATAFRHLGVIVRRGHVVDRRGKDVYMPRVDRLGIPIAFIHGENNRIFFPRGSEETYDWVRAANGEDLYVRHVIPGYAHMDCFVGKDASRDVFPIIHAELEKSALPA